MIFEDGEYYNWRDERWLGTIDVIGYMGTFQSNGQVCLNWGCIKEFNPTGEEFLNPYEAMD